jgi:hypothetical protein
MKFSAPLGLPQLAVAENATTPVPVNGAGSCVYSTVTGRAMVWDGAKWASIKRVPLAAPVLANATTITETVIARWALPANYLQAGDSFLANVGFQCAGAGTVILKARAGAAGTIADTLLETLTTSVAQVANAKGVAGFSFYAPSNTVLQATGWAMLQNATLGGLAAAPLTATVVPSAPIFLSITATYSVAAANTTRSAILNLNS